MTVYDSISENEKAGIAHRYIANSFKFWQDPTFKGTHFF